MHELSVCQALIGQVEKVARENDARRVVAITIAVGRTSSRPTGPTATTSSAGGGGPVNTSAPAAA